MSASPIAFVSSGRPQAAPLSDPDPIVGERVERQRLTSAEVYDYVEIMP